MCAEPFTIRTPPSERSRRARLRFNIRIYFRLIFLQLRMYVEYRGDFWIGIVGAVLMQGASLVFITAIFSRIPEIGGWTVWEISTLYGFTLMSYGLREVFCDGPWTLRGTINQGKFDQVLVRPLSPALQTATLISSIHGSGNFLLGLVVFLVATRRAGVDWTLLHIGWVLLAVVCGVVIVSCVAYLANIVAFWEPGTSSAFPFMISNLIELVKFPLELYGWVIRIGLSSILPFAFVSYYPALVLLGKDSSARWIGYLTPLVAFLMVAITAFIWGKAINRYQGSGH
ncbi:MAG: ABC transporter permease [Thermomicrobiales bacterium]